MIKKPLTELQCKNFQSQNKSYKKFDGGGMFLLVTANGKKYWRLKYKYGDKEKLISLGVYPTVSLKEARQRRDEFKLKLANNIDPSLERRKIKQKLIEHANNSFKNIALEWYNHKRGENTLTKDAKLELSRLNRHVFPYIGDIPIKDITAQDIIHISRIMENKGILSEAKRTRSIMNQIYKYAIITKRAEHNLIYETQGVYKLPKPNHYPHLDENEFKKFMKSFKNIRSTPLVKLALKLLILTFTRSGSIRLARWEEFDLEKNEWRIPANHMKNKKMHIVPITKQIVDILNKVKEINGGRMSGLLFYSSNRNKPLSDSTLSKLLKDNGYRGLATPHGFRSTASTILNENKFRADVIERQLSHCEKNQVRASYNHATYMDERKELMIWWNNYVEELENVA